MIHRWSGRLTVRTATATLMFLATPSCKIFGCSYDTRFAGAAGTSNSMAGNVTAEVNYRQYHNDNPVPSSVTWRVNGDHLASPATGMRLLSSTGAFIMDLSLSSTSQSSFTAASAHDIAAGDGDRIYDLLSAGSSVVVDLQNGSTIVVPLHVSSREGWHHPEC